MATCYGARRALGGRHPRLSAWWCVLFAAVSALFDTGESARHCSRPGCSERATVTLTYVYARSQVWLDDLRAERDPHASDLCRRHAERQSVPQGWHLADRRPIEAPAPALLAG
jgi:hypothetical protein